MFIIAKKAKGLRLTVSATPTVHPAIELAQEQARQLAKDEPGTEFFIFQAKELHSVKAEYTAKSETLS